MAVSSITGSLSWWNEGRITHRVCQVNQLSRGEGRGEIPNPHPIISSFTILLRLSHHGHDVGSCRFMYTWAG